MLHIFLFMFVYLYMCLFVRIFRSSSLRRKSMLESRQSEQPQLAAAAAAQTKPAQQTDVRMELHRFPKNSGQAKKQTCTLSFNGVFLSKPSCRF